MNNKRTYDGMIKPKLGYSNVPKPGYSSANVKKTGVMVSPGSGLNNFGNGQFQKSVKRQQRPIPHCWCCCADQSYTLENGHHVKMCPKWDTRRVPGTNDWIGIATYKLDATKTMSRNDNIEAIKKFINSHGLKSQFLARTNEGYSHIQKILLIIIILTL